MRIAEKSDDEIRTLVRTARDAGIDFFDHADIYGGELHRCEERFAEALDLSPRRARPGDDPDEGRDRPVGPPISTTPTST